MQTRQALRAEEKCATAQKVTGSRFLHILVFVSTHDHLKKRGRFLIGSP
jgi:hypothetical protein